MLATSDLAPLRRFYGEAQLQALCFAQCRGEDLPEPARSLLVHTGDMTSRLQSHFGEPVMVKALLVQPPGEGDERQTYAREVLLLTQQSRRPVEYGAIEIFLTAIREPAVREAILAARQPLGGILDAAGIGMTSAPGAYFSLRADENLADRLQIEAGRELHGRRNQLRLAAGPVLAEIVEIISA